MQINYDRELRGKQRAAKLGLLSDRFSQPQMSESAREEIERVKLKDRSYLKVRLWLCSWASGERRNTTNPTRLRN